MFRSVSVILSANSTTFVSQMRTAGAAMDDFHRKAEIGSAKTEAAATRAHSALTKLAVVTATVLAIGLASSVRAAAQFEVAMRNVSTISDEVRTNFAASSQQVIDLSTRLPQSAKVLAEGLYEIASSGFYGADGLEVLAKAATAASAGLTTTDTAAKGITAVLNAYGKSAAEAGDVSDVLFQTVNLGVVTFEELSGQLGDFVGTAAQLGVPIEDAAAAFAAMTLSGISAAEASTSVNRVMLSFIKPSEAMIAAAKTLGHESSVTMVRQLGLKGAIEAVSVATGGSIEAMARLFPEVRGLRGALALAAAEGENYNRTQEGIADATNRAGATQKALTEQMKAASAQWQIFRNQIDAGRIALGTALLPVLVDVMSGIQDFARDALPTLRAAWEDVQSAWEQVLPFFEATGEVGANLIEIIGDLVDRFGPLAAALGSVAATAFVGALIAAAEALSALTGFIAENETLATALAVAYGVKLVASLTAAAIAFGALKLEQVSVGLYNMVGAAEQGALALGAVNAVSLVGIIGITTLLVTELKRGKDEARALGVELKKNAGDLKAPDALQRIADEAERMTREVEKGAEKMKLLAQVSGMDLNFTDKKLKAIADAAAEASVEANRLAISFEENVNTVANATGLSADEVKKLADALGVDLTGAFGKSKGERQKLIDHVAYTSGKLDELKLKAYGAGAGMSDAFGKSEEDILAAAAAADKFTDSVTEAFSKGFDVLSNFADATKEHASALEAEASAADKVASAQDRVTDAAERAADAQEGITEAHERAAEAQEQVIEAHDRVAESEQDLIDLRIDVAERSAEAQERYAERVQDSNDDILRAEEDLAEKRISLAEDVADAQRRLEEDRLEGQERINAAEQRIRDVQKRAADDARERQQRENDRRRLDAAKTPEERQRIQAEIDRRKAREDEQKARDQAAKDLKDAQNDLQKIREDNAEREKKNQEALLKAQEDQAKGLAEAEQNVTKARKEALEVQKEGRELAKQAVEDEKQIAAAVKSVEDARRGVIEAQKNAADAVDAISDAERDAARASAEVGKARADQTKATEDLAAAQKKVQETSMEGFFDREVEKARKFAEGLREAARLGLDPDYIAQLMQEGPDKAAPILEAIMSNQGQFLVKQMNNARDGLKTVQEQMIEAARVTHRAITTTNDGMIGEYGKAMDILEAKAALGGKATGEAIARELGIRVEDVKRIAKDYGIQLADGINPLLTAIGAQPVAMDQEAGGARTSAGIQRAMGGTVPGSGDRDTVPAMLMPGEYVARKRVVKEQGVEAFNDLNAGRADIVRRYATGGFVYPDDVPVPPGQMDDYGTVLGFSGAMADQKMYYAVREFLAKHPPNPPSGGSGSAYGYQALIDFLNWKGIPHEVTSTVRDGAITASGNRSLHADGLAADFVSANMRQIFDTFKTITPSLAELFYDPAGHSVKGGQVVDWTAGGHDDHVHAGTFSGPGAGPGIPTGKGGDVDTSGDIRSWIDQAMRITGAPEDWREPLYRRAMFESGGRNIPQGIHDINTEMGTPAYGPMQVIEPTFNAHHEPGYDDWKNPVHNIAAAINYIECVPLDSKILTRSGWKTHDEVTVGDETIGYDPETGRSRWTKVTAVHIYDAAPVVRLSNSRFAARATGNHTWVSDKVIQTGKRTYKRQEMIRTDQIGTRHRLRLAAPFDNDAKLPITTAEAEILGWIMGDGSISRSVKHRTLNVFITQTKGKWMADLKALLAEVPHGVHVNKGNHWSKNPCYYFRIKSAYARDLLARSGYEADKSQMVLSMSDEQREAFLEGFWKADGYQNSKHPTWSRMIAQNEGAKLDAASLAIYMQGFYGHRIDNVGQKHVSFSKPFIKGGTFKKEHLGDQPVWCVTTDLGSWTMLQDDQIMLTGNSRYGSIHEIDPPVRGYGKGGLVDVLKNLPTFHAGGMVPGDQEVIARLEGGEGILSRQTMALGSPLAHQINTAVSTALRGYGGPGVASSPPIDIKALATMIGQEVTSAIAAAGIKVEANGKQIGDLVAERFAKMSKR